MISNSITEEQLREDKERESWALGDYLDTKCENCARIRVCVCPNGKHRCGKCNWVPEDKEYAPVR